MIDDELAAHARRPRTALNIGGRGRRGCGGAGRVADRRPARRHRRPRHDGFVPRSTRRLLQRYDQLRRSTVVAAAALNGTGARAATSTCRRSRSTRCAPSRRDGGLADCPHCGRACSCLLTVFFWFIGTAVVTVWFVFRDPKFDYRLLIVGAVLPAIVDALFGGARVLHSLTFSVVLLVVLMLATPRGTPIRRTLLALPIGTLLHLVFTGAWIESAGVLVAVPRLVVRGRRAPGRRARAGGTCCSKLIGLGSVRVGVRARRASPIQHERREFWRTGRLTLPIALAHSVVH